MARRPIRTICCRAVCQVLLWGDGSRMYAIQGLWSAAQLALGITFVIVKNDRYEALLEFGRHFGLQRTIGTSLPNIDFCALASGQGVKAISVNRRGALDEALRSAFATTAEPTLVEVASTEGRRVTSSVFAGEASRFHSRLRQSRTGCSDTA